MNGKRNDEKDKRKEEKRRIKSKILKIGRRQIDKTKDNKDKQLRKRKR